MLYQVRHKTNFRYAFPVSFARCNLRLRPVEWAGQSLEDYKLELSPSVRITGTRPIGYLGYVTRMVMEKRSRELSIESSFRIRVDRPTPVIRADDPTIGDVSALARTTRDMGVESPANYIYPSPSIPLSTEITAWCSEHLDAHRGVVQSGLALASRIHD
ncbi:MAG: transglutaminase family protein, partial [Sphingomonadales bacterium]